MFAHQPRIDADRIWIAGIQIAHTVCLLLGRCITFVISGSRFRERDGINDELCNMFRPAPCKRGEGQEKKSQVMRIAKERPYSHNHLFK